MAIIVSDSFNRADNPTSLGTADTGQAWTSVSGVWGIDSGDGVRFSSGTGTSGHAIIEGTLTDVIVKATLVNPSSVASFAGLTGILVRYFDSTHYFTLSYEKFPGPTYELRLHRTYGGTATVFSETKTLSDGDTISVACCGSLFQVYVNDVLQGSYNDGFNPQLYGTQYGLDSYDGTVPVGSTVSKFDNFLVTTNGTCTPTYNCLAGACVDPGDGTGTYATLAACLAGCSVAASYNCVNGQCIDPGTGLGMYATLAECAASGCGAITVETERFDAGTGSGYYYVAPVVDSGDELRSKTVKAVRATGKFTNAASQIYGYDVSDVVSATDLEQGLNSDTGQIAITDTAGVAQTPREQVNVPNAVLHTVRIVGDDTGETTRDSIHEIITEQGDIGVRR